MSMGLKDRNNPLGQRKPSDKVGATNPSFKHGQSAELVEEIKEKARQSRRPPKKHKIYTQDDEEENPFV